MAHFSGLSGDWSASLLKDATPPHTVVLGESYVDLDLIEQNQQIEAGLPKPVFMALQRFAGAGNFVDVVDFLAQQRHQLAVQEDHPSASLFGVMRDANVPSAQRTCTTFLIAYKSSQPHVSYLYDYIFTEQKLLAVEGLVQERMGYRWLNLTTFKYQEAVAGQGECMWLHTHWRHIQPILQYCSRLFAIAQEPLAPVVLLSTLAELHWWFVQACPFVRGSRTIAWWLLLYILYEHGIVWSNGYTDMSTLALACHHVGDYQALFAKYFAATQHVSQRFGTSYAQRLVQAARMGQHQQVLQELSRTAAGSRAPTGFTALYMAAAAGHARVVKSLLCAAAPVDDPLPANGQTALHAAAEAGHLKVVEHLVDHGARVNQADSEGDTPLHLAIRAKHINTTRYLLAYAADAARNNKYGHTPLHDAALSGDVRLVRLLLAYPRSQKALNQSNDNAQTPLSLAALAGHTAVVRCLLKHGALPPLQNPQLLAIQLAHRSCERQILALGVDASMYRLYDKVAQRDHVEVMRLLKEHLLRDFAGAAKQSLQGLLLKAYGA